MNNFINTDTYRGVARYALAVFTAFAIAGGFFAPNANAVVSSINLTSPDGSEHWNGTHDITWTATGDPGDTVGILLSDNDFVTSATLVVAIAYDAGSFAWDTATVLDGTNYKIKVQSPLGVFDTSATPFTIDNTAPTITSRVTLDTDGNGNVDRLNLTFSEPVRDSYFSAASFAIDSQPGTSIDTGGTADDNTFSVLFDGVVDTGQKNVTYTAGTGTDMATPGNLLATNTALATDSAAPVFLSAQTLTTTTIRATFSEDLNGSTVNPTGTDFTVTGHIVGSADEEPNDSGIVVITLSDTMTTDETPTVNYVGLIEDLNDNIALNVSKIATDGVTPVLAEVTPVTTPTMDNTPDYTFSSSEAGAITYGVSCSSVTAAATAGNNPITFNALADGTYNDCTITVTDSSSNVSTPLSISPFQVDTTPVGVINITDTEPDALQIGLNPPFSPALGSSLLRTDDAFYAVRAISIVDQSIPNVQWKIIIDGPSALTPDMVDLDEVGWQDPDETSTQVFHYPFTVVGDDLVATGSCEVADLHNNGCDTDSFDVDPTDNFKNVDRVNFAATAPLGTYTIKRQLIEGGTTPRSNELMVATFTVTNNPPLLDVIDEETVDELTELAFQATASDIEGSILTFTLEDAPAGASITSGGDFTWTPTEEQGGNPSTLYSFTVIVTDADGGIDSQLVTVTVNEVNVAPVANDGDLETDEDTPLLIELDYTDIDLPANTVTFSIVDEPEDGTLSGFDPETGEVTYTPDENYNGDDSFTFQVNDGTVDSNIATVNITVDQVNDAPELAAISDQAVVAGNLLNFTANSTDVDGGAPMYSLDGNPLGSSIDSSTGLFSWTPTIADVYSFDVVVSDGNGGTDSQTVQVTVNHAAIAKVIVSAAPTNLSVEDESTISVAGKDQFDNVATSDNSTIVVLSADNGGSLGTTLLTLSSGLAETTLSKSSAGDVHVNASSGVLTPSQVTVTFNAVPGDETTPTILSHNPADDSTDVSVSVTPFLVFSEPLKSSTVNSTNIQLKKYSDDSVVPATVSLVEGGTRVNIDPTNPLENNTQYYFAVSTGVQDEVGNALVEALDEDTKSDHEFTTVAVVPIVVDEVIAQNSTAAATDSYLDGWHYTFRITVNTNETDLSVKFTDWINSADPDEIVAANGNMRLLFNTDTGNGLGSIVGLTDADIISGVGPIASFAIGNEYTDQTPGAIDISALDISTDSGRQIKFDVYTKLPITTAPGFYTTVYGIQAN